MITDFPPKQGNNIGGAAGFRFVPVYLLSIPLPVARGMQITDAFNFTAGNFYTGYATLETLQFSETAKQDDNGPVYDWQINGFTPGDSAALAQLMQDMELQRHLVICQDMAGLYRVVGYNAPLDFISIYSPGNDVSSARGYNWTFSGSGAKRAPVYAVS